MFVRFGKAKRGASVALATSEMRVCRRACHVGRLRTAANWLRTAANWRAFGPFFGIRFGGTNCAERTPSNSLCRSRTVSAATKHTRRDTLGAEEKSLAKSGCFAALFNRPFIISPWSIRNRAQNLQPANQMSVRSNWAAIALIAFRYVTGCVFPAVFIRRVVCYSNSVCYLNRVFE